MDRGMKRLSLLTIFSLCLPITLLSEESLRTWTNLKGQKIEARFVRLKTDGVEIKRVDGRTFTVSPSDFSKVDQDYISEVSKRLGADGRPWGKESAIFALTKGKWLDHTEEQIPSKRVYWTFSRGKVDLNGDGKNDGWLVQARANSPGAKPRGFAWAVSDIGELTIRYPFAKDYRELLFQYDSDSGVFLLKKGSGLAKYFKPAP